MSFMFAILLRLLKLYTETQTRLFQDLNRAQSRPLQDYSRVEVLTPNPMNSLALTHWKLGSLQGNK